MKQKILERLFSDNKLTTYAKRLCGNNDLSNDLIQELYIYLNDKEDCFIIELNDKRELFFYSYRIMYYSWSSPTSPFYRKFKNTQYSDIKDMGVRMDIEAEECDLFDYAKWINKIESDVKNGWYNGKVHTEGVLMLKYLELGSYREVAKEMDIPHTTVQYIVQKYAKKLKDE